jgi:hypothetical protein
LLASTFQSIPSNAIATFRFRRNGGPFASEGFGPSSDHKPPCRHSAHTETARELDEVREAAATRRPLPEMATTMASLSASAPHHLVAGHLSSPRLGWRGGRNGVTISMRAQVDTRPAQPQLLSLRFSFLPQFAHAFLPCCCPNNPFVRLFDRRRRAVVTLEVTAEAGAEAAGGECGVVGNLYVQQPHSGGISFLCVITRLVN